MNNNVLWSAEQINIPQDLGSILKDYTKNLIRAAPRTEDVYKWSANYFAERSGHQPPFQLLGEEDYVNENFGADQGSYYSIVVVGPSGVGKSTLIQQLMTEFPDNFGFSVSHTARGPRPGEIDGIHYYFVSREEMERKIQNGDFIEHAVVHGNPYGTSFETVQNVTRDKNCILDVDVQGALSIRKTNLKPAYFIFIAPPSFDDLERRLRGRGTETEDKLQVRLANAKKEMAHMNDTGLFDKVIINNDLETCYEEFKATIVGLFDTT